MRKRLEKGLLIVIEGIDGAGKTTQCGRLEQWLLAEGWDVSRLREPTDGPHGRRIRELARVGRDGVSAREEMELFLRDREQNVESNIRPALERGAIVLLDRYYYSTIAYQGARGLDPDFIRAENEKFAPPADLLIYLSIPAELCGDRIENQRGETRDLFEKEEYLKRVKVIFDSMTDPQLLRIDASGDPDVIFSKIRDAVQARLN
jgi:dTMP kinase